MTDKSITPRKSPIPRKLDDAMITALTTIISKGNYYQDACAICDVTEGTFYQWVRLAKEDEDKGLTEQDSVYLKLSYGIKRARAQARANMVSVIVEAATVKKEWLPAITYLERTDPANWGRKDRIQPEDTRERVKTFVFVLPDGTRVKPGELDSGDEIVDGKFKELPEGKPDDKVT